MKDVRHIYIVLGLSFTRAECNEHILRMAGSELWINFTNIYNIIKYEEIFGFGRSFLCGLRFHGL